MDFELPSERSDRCNIDHQMPGRRLVRDCIIEQDRDRYRLNPPFDALAEWQRLELMAIYECRIEEHRAAYGDLSAKRTVDAVSGSIRYEALKRIGARCDLRGASHEARRPHVNHGAPRAKGGSNELSNLQVLCEMWNADKRDRDDTNFRQPQRASR